MSVSSRQPFAVAIAAVPAGGPFLRAVRNRVDAATCRGWRKQALLAMAALLVARSVRLPRAA
ncbi:MAG: hypothetical protein EHM59_01295 [Betaproteobacteria bacterium]|nr:MAG: hypothetical protein EHM59_09635 [Betaproteobacteria bacterium]RPI48437.1 MAG: hypothetical protein EHM59_01295 [Betaproteobacteria bacterium]